MWFTFMFAKRVLPVFSFLAITAQAATCTYETWDWDTRTKKSINHRKIQKEKANLTKEERGDISGCTVCSEDQVEVQLPHLPGFKVCKVFEEKIIRAIKKSQAEKFPIQSIVGYRVGKSKGPMNAQGQRTEFSNHSFGTALDFNSERNGLYDSCLQFSPQCRLIRGGEYQGHLPGTITRDTVLYKAMLAEGFLWGGEIKGKQKDFMHFSITGM